MSISLSPLSALSPAITTGLIPVVQGMRSRQMDFRQSRGNEAVWAGLKAAVKIVILEVQS